MGTGRIAAGEAERALGDCGGWVMRAREGKRAEEEGRERGTRRRDGVESIQGNI